ncbi:MAG: ABC transporter substrate-binding protein [Desulfovibrio sp.]|nr:ABC transporter substrate-binding protein [Desulfovibrio sp.]
MFKSVFQIFVMAAALCLPLSATAANPVLVGMNTPVTGASAGEAVYFTKAAKLAEKHANDAGVNIKLIIQDNQSTNPGALQALNKSIEQDKVFAVLGPIKSTQVLAISDRVKQAEIPTLIGGTNVNLTHQGNPWFFRCRPDDSIVVHVMLKYIREDMKLNKIGVLHDADAFGTGGADLVARLAPQYGLTLVKREKYTTKDKDYTAQLLSLKAAGTEVMIHYGTNVEDVAVCQRQFRQLGLPYKYLGSPSSAVNDTLSLAGKAAEGVLAVADAIPDGTREYRDYAQAYMKEYGEEMDAWAAWNYDALMILAKAIKEVGPDRAKVRKAILGLRDYQGVLGTYSFTDNGDGRHSACIVEVKNGHPVLKKVVTVSAE